MSTTSMRLYRLLLGGWDQSDTVANNTAALDAELTNVNAWGALWLLMNNSTTAQNLADSGYARELLFKSSAALGIALSSPIFTAAIFGNSYYQTELEAIVSGGSYFIKSATITATGTWNIPANGLQAMYVLALGHGGNGGNQAGAQSGQGGSGGELTGRIISKSMLPSSNVSVTIPTSSGTATTFGTLVSAESGVDGSTTESQNPGGGSDVNGGSAKISNVDLDSAAWHLDYFNLQGGYGGRSYNEADSLSQAGEDGINGTGGAVATAGSSSDEQGKAGTGFGSGGSSGYADNGSTATIDGESAAANSGCGGGGSASADGSPGGSNGGTGGTGKVWVYYVEGRA